MRGFARFLRTKMRKVKVKYVRSTSTTIAILFSRES